MSGFAHWIKHGYCLNLNKINQEDIKKIISLSVNISKASVPDEKMRDIFMLYAGVLNFITHEDIAVDGLILNEAILSIVRDLSLIKSFLGDNKISDLDSLINELDKRIYFAHKKSKKRDIRNHERTRKKWLAYFRNGGEL